MRNRLFLLVALIVCIFFPLTADDSVGAVANESAASVPADVEQSVPNAYRSIALGTDIDTVKTQLQQDGSFGYRGESDVSLLPFENRSLIETAGSYFIKRAWFQFHNDSLYIISVALNTEKTDYYSLYTSLVKKYGEPISLNPRTAVWENESVRMILERPLTVRYISLPVFNELLQKKMAGEDYQEQLKDDFIEQF